MDGKVHPHGGVIVLDNEISRQIQRIYGALSDDVSRKIYKHRLLFSLTGEKDEISQMVRECSPGAEFLGSKKVCFYGAGGGAHWLVRYMKRDTFVIDRDKTGTIEGHPIIAFDEFIAMPDYKEYVVVITVGKEDARHEIQAMLAGHGIDYLFGYFDFQYFDLQYFDLPGMKLQDEYFVDAGALDGETTKYFLEHFENGHAYVFEPNMEQFRITEQNLQGYDNVTFYPYGLYDRNSTMRFASCDYDSGSAKVSETGDSQIEVRRLDEVLAGKKVTFIKMDIEGSELAALKGAEQTIREQKPKLAICVYHKPEDIWEIPNLLLGYVPEYRLYLRHYSITNTETVLYAIP